MNRRDDWFLYFEKFLTFLIIAALSYSVYHLFKYQYFPQPFFYDVGDTWMDWFNPAYWSHQPGAYDSYMTIYPPLTYVILRSITSEACYVNAQGGWSRECDWLGVGSLLTTYLICCVVTYKTLKKVDSDTAIPRSLCLCLGLPFMWALDRGNVIMLTYIFLILGFGPLLGSARLRWLFVGMAVNMKIYLIGTIAAQLLHRRWRWAEGAILMTLFVYFFTLAVFDAGTPFEIFQNIVAYSEGLVINNPLDVWMASTLLPLEQLMNSNVFPSTLILGSKNVEIILSIIPIIMRSAQIIVIIAAISCFVRSEVVPRYRMIAISIGLAIFTSEVSSYSQILVIVFCFIEKAEGWLRRIAISICYIVCIPYDFNLDTLPPIVQDSYFFRTGVIVEHVVQIGPFIRPLLTMSIPVLLSILTIKDVWLDLRNQGWANRWRFRHDAPLLPWIKRPEPLAASL